MFLAEESATAVYSVVITDHVFASLAIEEELLGAIAGADAVLVCYAPVTRRVIERMEPISARRRCTRTACARSTWTSCLAMKSSAFLLNTARGPLVVESALVRALEEGWIAGAALDVLEREPPGRDHPLQRLDNVILTPHVAFYSEESVRELQRKAAEEVVRALSGQPLRSPVNTRRPAPP